MWRRLAIHGGLFVATALTMTLSFGYDGEHPERLEEGLFFALPALLIIGCHEFGHYFMARAHGVDCTLPYFIPLPLGFDTLGAVIRLKGTIPSRNALFDIGVGGPLAGLLIALPLLLVGVWHSPPIASATPSFPPTYSLIHQASEFGIWLRHWFDGVSTPPSAAPTAFFMGDNLLTWGLSRITWGKLADGMDLNGHPVFIAAWFGMLVTTLNLMPVGQLDGGHVMRAFFGPKAEAYGHHVASALIILALACSGSWLVWFFVVTQLVGFGHPAPVDDVTPLSKGRRLLSYVTWVLTVLVFIPVPFDVVA